MSAVRSALLGGLLYFNLTVALLPADMYMEKGGLCLPFDLREFKPSQFGRVEGLFSGAVLLS